MNRTRPDERTMAGVRAEHFPGFSAFAKGYLHEDYVDEYGSAEQALHAFCDDAGPAECRRLLIELEILTRVFASVSLTDQQRILALELRSGWEPETTSDLMRLLDPLRERIGPRSAAAES